MKKNILIPIIIILSVVGYLVFTQNKSNKISEAPAPTFAWRYEVGALTPDGTPGTQVFLDVTYESGKVLSRKVDEVNGSCAAIDRAEDDTDILEGTSKIQCYAAGLGQWYKITKGENSYPVQKKTFEEALPDQTPPVTEYETIIEFPLS